MLCFCLLLSGSLSLLSASRYVPTARISFFLLLSGSHHNVLIVSLATGDARLTSVRTCGHIGSHLNALILSPATGAAGFGGSGSCAAVSHGVCNSMGWFTGDQGC